MSYNCISSNMRDTNGIIIRRCLVKNLLIFLKIKFVIKGGMLIASIVGLDIRSTMDLDTTLRGLPLTEEKVLEAVGNIIRIDLEDEVTFETVSINTIRKDDNYGGFCVKINAIFDTMLIPLSIDVSTGDIITPGTILYEFGGIFDENVQIRLWGYNIETVMAEKTETILSRGVLNTRPRDYYDVHIIGTTQKFDRQVFEDALSATAEHRGSIDNIADRARIIDRISDSNDLQIMWKKYQRRFSFVNDIKYEDIITVLRELLL